MTLFISYILVAIIGFALGYGLTRVKKKVTADITQAEIVASAGIDKMHEAAQAVKKEEVKISNDLKKI